MNLVKYPLYHYSAKYKMIFWVFVCIKRLLSISSNYSENMSIHSCLRHKISFPWNKQQSLSEKMLQLDISLIRWTLVFIKNNWKKDGLNLSRYEHWVVLEKCSEDMVSLWCLVHLLWKRIPDKNDKFRVFQIRDIKFWISYGFSNNTCYIYSNCVFIVWVINKHLFFRCFKEHECKKSKISSSTFLMCWVSALSRNTLYF